MGENDKPWTLPLTENFASHCNAVLGILVVVFMLAWYASAKLSMWVIGCETWAPELGLAASLVTTLLCLVFGDDELEHLRNK